jgi:hypothetical protein
MRAAVFIGFAIAFAAAASAQDLPARTDPSAGERPKRDYSGRIQMHETPLDVSVPDTSLDEKKSLSESLGLPEEPAVHNSVSPPPAPGLRIRPDEMQKSKNWILPPSPDGKPRETEKEPEPSGWGWLADEVLNKQKQQNQSDAESPDPDSPEGQQDGAGREGSSRQERDGSSSQERDGQEAGKHDLLLKFEPVPTNDGTDESRKRKPMDAVVENSKSGESDKKDEKDGERNEEASPDGKGDRRAADSETRDRPFGMDRVWDSDRTRDRDQKADNPLSQTAALLSPGHDDAAAGRATPGAFEATILRPVIPDSGVSAAPTEPASVSTLPSPAWGGNAETPAFKGMDSYAPSASQPKNPYDSPLNSRSFSPPSALTPSTTLPGDTAPALKDPWAMPSAP